MDLVDTLRKKIDILEDGDHLLGLKAVLLHIETAFSHLSRGRENDDHTAFTDAIYRTNQAFEGIIKEAYRVLAEQDPAKKRPFDIENYLEQNSIFRSRVLSQFTTYRTEWRNPSTHDYKLNFDESEAFLAIISVSAFACLLLDQIAERLAFKQSQSEAEERKTTLAASLLESMNADLLVRLTELITKFCSIHQPPATSMHEVHFIGSLHGFLSSAAPDLDVQTEVKFDKARPDLLVTRGDERIVVEVKLSRRFARQNYLNAVSQVENYLLMSGIKNGIVLFLPDSPSKMEIVESLVKKIDIKIIVLMPVRSDV